ncbi:hypothetical protein [Noviherbaspirillum sedimenti]|uniref:Uncharacterized protein n=1 Tax=Noviherbaspirillum sedimenti TaxID=2320865 RepID=A0A3A3GKJ6_9BURK|nr:hypothetical protein [Noviherbaspirillum sedimenti]RJG01480.1 hypothetical protein D3878_07680 [Noviherbaspirillum sedimenti]
MVKLPHVTFKRWKQELETYYPKVRIHTNRYGAVALDMSMPFPGRVGQWIREIGGSLDKPNACN